MINARSQAEIADESDINDPFRKKKKSIVEQASAQSYVEGLVSSDDKWSDEN